MNSGTVKFFNKTKGFGFIVSDNGGDIFVHYTGLALGVEIKDGDRVSYDEKEGRKGMNAINVTTL